ncbi:hypothetical protein [Paramagnetospirillum magneticum]|uniref:Uncharacterized protein n=1 Tax=Paramagnetospirillum magneticum (strain ATCC 700264 / AMB-1) TaxID=342108 RepID=Q2W4I2_PARM1|nr:hypothetical protein [Paramagnetospirillum magneticum]BAE51204.1 hypothetical protein amb2400 [Paramagnetospirillum magneticum AMB-1]BAE51243.1 hypothetical protein amb2439 [Paramagnetospirillum magneticum AMB-1]
MTPMLIPALFQLVGVIVLALFAVAFPRFGVGIWIGLFIGWGLWS